MFLATLFRVLVGIVGHPTWVFVSSQLDNPGLINFDYENWRVIPSHSCPNECPNKSTWQFKLVPPAKPRFFWGAPGAAEVERPQTIASPSALQRTNSGVEDGETPGGDVGEVEDEPNTLKLTRSRTLVSWECDWPVGSGKQIFIYIYVYVYIYIYVYVNIYI